MPEGIEVSPDLKAMLKEALAETLLESKGLFQDVFAEVLEDFALREAIREGEDTVFVSRSEIENVLSKRR